MFKYTNDLIHESSPYLLQHAHNPVQWHPWGEHSLNKAKDENKILIISIGYAACHWCHVMEHESFEDTAVARIMNEHFVSIKVDREERPDVDQIYMNAAYLIAGNGGWPLNVLALPDGKPFFAGTYFTKENWIKVLNYFIDIQNNNPSALIHQADHITDGIKSTAKFDLIQGELIVSRSDLDEIFQNLKTTIDFKNGGLKQTIKFPMPSCWEFLMYYHYLSHNPEVLQAVTTTLDKMASGGIYDQIGGGFSRYATDEYWHVPHFEKMLYDNAQLVSLYAHAWQMTKNPLYKDVVYQTLEFIEYELTAPDGGFYSSLDADSESEEGKFYAWTIEEVEFILGAEAPLFLAYFNITRPGNWEYGKNILFRKLSDENFAEKQKMTITELRNKLNKSKEMMLNARAKRVRPELDDKILTSWNALMLKGYVDAYRAFGEEKFLKKALHCAQFLSRNAIHANYEITRNYKNGKSSIPGLLDDYSFSISAFIALYQATFDEMWLYKAKELSEYTLVHFYDSLSGMFYYTHDLHHKLIARKMEIEDNVIPSSNSEMAKNLIFLGHYFYDEAFIQKARQMFNNVQKDLHANIYFYSNWGIVGIHLIQPLFEVAVVGTDWNNLRKTLDNTYLPDVILMGGKHEGTLKLLENKLVKGQTTIYVCRDKTCKLPVTDAATALRQLK